MNGFTRLGIKIPWTGSRPWRLAQVVCLLGLLTGAAPPSFGSSRAPQLGIDSGKIAGGVAGQRGDVWVFKGIPYAAPPVGALRWRPPQPAAPWEGVRACTAFGPACPQPDVLSRLYGAKFHAVSEDCLYLNVWTPAGGGDERLPVMVWIHGGGNISGAASTPHYDGEALARKGVVLVSVNYRLGPLGFLAHPLLSMESERGVSGNYGLLDQVAALQWVARNIEAFGGDPGRVTIFGESAGGLNVCCLMASPLARGLFHRAIAQSGHAFGRIRHLRAPSRGQEAGEAQGERLAAELGCSSSPNPLACLRSVPANRLLEASKPTIGLMGEAGDRFGPAVDGWALPDDIPAMYEQGRQSPVPLLAGSNAHEGTIFTLNPPIRTVAAYRLALEAVYGHLAGAVFSLYPAREDGDVPKALSDALGDLGFVGGMRAFVRGMASVGTKAFLYHFTMRPAGAWGERLGAFHGAEIPYVFDNLDKGRMRPDEKQRALAHAMGGYWVRFAGTGDPNGPGRPMWPAYDAASDQHLELGEVIRVDRGLRKEACDLFDRILATHKGGR